jgi:hypothetical protein
MHLHGRNTIMKKEQNHVVSAEKPAGRRTTGGSTEQVPEGTPWQFYLLMVIIVAGLVALVVRTVLGF